VNKKTLILLIVLISGIALVLIMQPSKAPKVTSKVSTPVDFELMDMNRNTFKLSDMRGSVVFINFWATWCQSCIEEMPSIERMSGLLSNDSKFKIMTILFKDDIASASGFMRQNSYTFPVYLNPDESAAKNFGITGVPETFILDKKGFLRDKVIGPAEWDSPRIIQTFQNLLNEP
jgi:cytochrome c biogenesis protein CcmG/thiol:disulfide interchange protein DsbE